MAHRLWQAWRGTTAQVDAVTPSSGEPIWETDGLKLAIGDGSTAGGLHVMMGDVSDYVAKALFDAYSILYADTDDTPAALTIAASRIVGRKASGGIAAMTGAETLALLTGANLDVGAFNVRGQTVTADGLTAGRIVYTGANGLLSVAAGFTYAATTLTVPKIGVFEATGLITSTSDRGFATTATFVPDASRLDYAFSIGNRASELTVNLANAASQNLELFQMNVNLTASGGAPTSTSTVSLFRVRSTHDTVDMPNLRLRSINTYMDIRKNLQDAYGVIHGLDFYTNAVAVGGEAAAGVFNIDANSAVTGNVRGVIINVYGGGLPSTTSIGLEVRTDGGVATLNEGIRIWSVGGNSINYGLYIDGTINTADIRFQGGTTLVDDGTNLSMAGANLALLADNQKIIFGTGSDNEIYHDGSHFIMDAGSGSLRVYTTGSYEGLQIHTSSIYAGLIVRQLSIPTATYPVFTFYGQAQDAEGVNMTYGVINIKAQNVSSGTEEGRFEVALAVAGAQGNVAFYVTGAGEGFFDFAGSGDALPTVFDEYDDARQLQLASQGQVDVLLDMGVAVKVERHRGYMLSQNKFNWVLAGGIYQNRARIDDLAETVEYKINRLEVELAELQASLN